MATYQIQINERTAVGRQTVEFLRAIPEVVSFKTGDRQAAAAAVDPRRNTLYKGFLAALRDTRLMLDGKKRKKVLI
jgi:hypothetical protein